MQSFHIVRLRAFAALLLPNLLAGCLEEWQLQLLTFFASRIGEIEVIGARPGE